MVRCPRCVKVRHLGETSVNAIYMIAGFPVENGKFDRPTNAYAVERRPTSAYAFEDGEYPLESSRMF